MSRFELRIAGALVLAAVLPLSAALWLANRLAEANLTLALNPRVVARLEQTPALYGELFRARRELYQLQAVMIVRSLPKDREQASRALAAAIQRTPRLLRVRWTDPSGAVIAEVENPEPRDEGQIRHTPVTLPLPDEGTLEAEFATEARFFAELDEARDLAEAYRGMGALLPQIRQSYVKAFAALLVAWALAAGILGVLIARRTTKRVGALIRATGELARGNLSVSVDPGRDKDEVAGLARAFNDMVREVREGRDRIVYLEKISGWQDVARRLAHEIKNPLTPIQLALQQLEAGYAGQDPRFKKTLAEVGQIVREEVGTLQRLVDDFAGFAKLPEVRAEPADLGAFVEEFLKTSPQVGEGADVDVKLDGPTPVGLDRTLMRRVLTNLVRNATEAARPSRARVHLAVERRRESAALTVADEGPGIPEDVRSRIFDPYFTTKSDGTGLGLAIVKKIVLQHGGEIAVGTREGGGAVFTLTLPLRLEDAAATVGYRQAT